MLTISRLSLWSINYYETTANEARQSAMDRQAANGGLGEYYRTNVTGGPGSFVITIEDFDSFAEAMTNKLVNEIASAAEPHILATRLGRSRTLD